MKVFESDLILTENTVFDSSITVKGNIICKDGLWNIKASNINASNINASNIDAWNINAGNISARNIDAGNIDAGNIDAGNISARDINACNINAGNINAGNIICETRILKNKNSKTTCRILITNKSKLERKEQILKKGTDGTK